MTEEAAERMNSIRIKERLLVEVVGTKDLNLDEVIEIQIDLGSIQTKIKAHVVPNAPADILLGQEFLLKYSKGFVAMLKEFCIPHDSVKDDGKSSICSVCLKNKLE